MASWADASVFYHIYPLGLTGAPAENDFSSAPASRILVLEEWLPHIADLGCDALYIGPIFESVRHGYDTVDYFTLDRRLGTNGDFRRVCEAARRLGMRIALDAVFNHVGLSHPHFLDLAERREGSRYKDWFVGVDFSKPAGHGRPFMYEGWQGHYSLPRLNLKNPEVKAYLFSAVDSWIREFGIDGLRLDAADCLDFGFLRELSVFCKSRRPDFWLMGELTHGDYGKWMREGGLDSITNYECYKGLYSSMNDANMFEIAHSLKRQFGEHGLYRGASLYSFLDNHDVDRVATILKDPAKLYPLYFLMFAMPGIPSIYYGSEWGIAGRKLPDSDSGLRPALDLGDLTRDPPQPNLPGDIKRLACMRKSRPELTGGGYHEVHVSHERIAFFRDNGSSRVLVAVNASAKPWELSLKAFSPSGRHVDPLNGNQGLAARGTDLCLTVPARWGRLVCPG
jgi:glycosidase